ncbi:MAG: bifunctional diguanylate cyclase/phosphodiesterase [Pseudohongiellaceae bacterium]
MGDNAVRLLHSVDEQTQSSHEIRLLFLDILHNNTVTALFQPIIDFNRQTIFGYESLIRGPSDNPLHNPVMLFDVARREGSLTELDLLCRRAGIRGFKEKRLGGKLFLNTTPQGLLEPGHRTGLTLEFLHEIGLKPENVVIELTEQYPLTDFSVMGNALEHYRRMGFEIAIDDLGAGYSGLRRWSELRPEYVKVDRHFIQNIHADPVKQSFVRSIVDIAKGLNCKVIAEGIESREESQTLMDMGIAYGQGYYFARPQSVPPYSIPEVLFRFPDRSQVKNQLWQNRENIADLLTDAPFLTRSNILEDAYQYFVEDDMLSAIAVVDEHLSPVGLIRRSRLLSTFSSQYGRSLHGAKSVLNFMDRLIVVVEKSWNIEQVSNLVTDNMKSQIEADFIIIENGKYAGLGKVLGLLKKITDLQIRNARYANPLTLLPGNVPIYECLDQLIAEQQQFAVAYCDIDNFKPYNDVYGYGEGDKVIKLIADILRGEVHKADDFIGHVGGDDFIIIFSSQDWTERCDRILQEFSSQISELYTEEDRRRGGIYSLSREGEERFFPIMSLSIGVVLPNTRQFISHHDIANMASHAKHNAKNIQGNSLFIERRHC